MKLRHVQLVQGNCEVIKTMLMTNPKVRLAARPKAVRDITTITMWASQQGKIVSAGKPA